MENVKNVVTYINLLLRYVTSGILGVFIYAYVTGAHPKDIARAYDTSVLTVVAAMSGLAGLIAYAVHHSLLDKMMYRFSLRIFSRDRRLPVKLLRATVIFGQTKSKMNWKKQKLRLITFQLITQTYLRKSSDSKRVRKLQKDIDVNLAMLNFMYCTILFSVIIPVYYWLPVIYHHKFSFGNREYTIMIFLFTMVLASLSWDGYITRRELWIVDHFFQEEEETKLSRT